MAYDPRHFVFFKEECGSITIVSDHWLCWLSRKAPSKNTKVNLNKKVVTFRPLTALRPILITWFMKMKKKNQSIVITGIGMQNCHVSWLRTTDLIIVFLSSYIAFKKPRRKNKVAFSLPLIWRHWRSWAHPPYWIFRRHIIIHVNNEGEAFDETREIAPFTLSFVRIVHQGDSQLCRKEARTHVGGVEFSQSDKGCQGDFGNRRT